MADDDNCPVGFLVDVSVPDPDPVEEFLKNKETQDTEDKENHFPNNVSVDPIEISRSDDSERRLSVTLEKPLELEDRVLKDVTQSTVGNFGRSAEESPEIQLLDEETFDFDLALSPQVVLTKKNEEDGEEEVFFGPVGFTERIVAATVGPVDEIKPMSPLNPAQIAEMVKEAHFVACRIASMKNDSSSDDGKSPTKRSLFSPNGKCHVRTGTFKMDIEEVKKQPEKVRRSIPCIDFLEDNEENVPLNSQRMPPIERQTSPGVELRKRKSSSDDASSGTGTDNKKHSDSETKENKPSRLTRLPRNRSYTLLKEAPSNESLEMNSAGDRVRHVSSGSDTASETCSVVSDNSDASFTKPSSQLRRSLQQTLKAPLGKGSQGSRLSRIQAPGGKSTGLKKPSGLVKPGGSSALTARNLQRASPACNSEQNRHNRTHSNSSNSSVSSTASNKSASQLQNPSGAKSGLPLTKMQLMQPGKLQKTSLAFNRNKLSEASSSKKKAAGPMKAVAPSVDEKAQSPHRASTNRSMRIKGTPVKPDKMVQPKNLSSGFTTPVKSGSQSSCGQSTPVSERKDKRRSFLPTPSKSSTSSAPPASPFSVRSSVSSNSSFGSRKSLSLTSESPVFVMDKHATATRKRIPSGNTKGFSGLDENTPSALKPRRALVQHTPDIPKQTISRWSPVRRTRQLSAEEQAMQCTKRQHRLPQK